MKFIQARGVSYANPVSRKGGAHTTGVAYALQPISQVLRFSCELNVFNAMKISGTWDRRRCGSQLHGPSGPLIEPRSIFLPPCRPTQCSQARGTCACFVVRRDDSHVWSLLPLTGRIPAEPRWPAGAPPNISQSLGSCTHRRSPEICGGQNDEIHTYTLL